jgi:cytoskeletal protein RodZ
MESFGETLKKTRERFNIDIDEAERMTSISRIYIEALEEENLEAFPGEPYLVGFLRNYSEYLGLDAKHMISLYKAKRIQEAPIPEALLKDIKPKKWIPVVIVVTAFVLVSGLVTGLLLWKKSKSEAQNNLLTEESKGRHYDISAVPITKRVYEGDTLGLLLNGENIILKIHETHTELAVDTPVGILYAELGDETALDVNGDKTDDIVIFVSDISKTDASRGAELRMFTKTSKDTVVVQTPVEEEIPVENVTDTKVSNSQNVLFEGGRAYPFTINASFRGACLYRYQCDRKESVEDFYTSGDVLTMQAQNGIRVWMSNANSVKMQVIGDGRTVDVEIGRPGQVLVQDIKWIKDTDGRYKLVVLEVD